LDTPTGQVVTTTTIPSRNGHLPDQENSSGGGSNADLYIGLIFLFFDGYFRKYSKGSANYMGDKAMQPVTVLAAIW